MLEVSSIVQLVQRGKTLSHLPKHVIPIIYESLISSFVFPWKHVSDQLQDYDRRCLILREYIGCLAQDFINLEEASFVAGNNQQAKIETISSAILPNFKEVIAFFKESNNTVKEMLVNAFKVSKELS